MKNQICREMTKIIHLFFPGEFCSIDEISYGGCSDSESITNKAKTHENENDHRLAFLTIIIGRIL